MLPSNRLYGFWLALLRIALGAAWLVHAVPKFTTGAFMPPDGFMPKLLAQGVQNTTGPYHDFLLNTVTPNVGLFAELIRAGEAIVGTLLVLGFLSRIGALGGLFLLANYMLVQGEPSTLTGWSGLDGAMVLLCAINVVLPTGRVLGLDWFFNRPRRAIPVAAAPYAGPEPTVTAPDGTVQAEFVDEAPMNGPSAPPG